MYIATYIYISINLANKSVHLVAGISQNHKINMDLEIIESTGISPSHTYGTAYVHVLFHLRCSCWVGCPLRSIHAMVVHVDDVCTKYNKS